MLAGEMPSLLQQWLVTARDERIRCMIDLSGGLVVMGRIVAFDATTILMVTDERRKVRPNHITVAYTAIARGAVVQLKAADPDEL